MTPISTRLPAQEIRALSRDDVESVSGGGIFQDFIDAMTGAAGELGNAFGSLVRAFLNNGKPQTF